MAGHSKWANIQHRKKKQDAKRSKLFTKLIREIVVASRMGNGGGPRLDLAVRCALDANMTRDTIDRAIKRGVGGGEDSNMEEVRYEGYGPSGVAVMVDCLTDNRTRTVGEVRHAFSKCGGNLGTDGSVAYIFSKKGILTFEPGSNEDRIMEVALEAGADDVTTNEDGSIDVTTTPEDFEQVKTAMQVQKLEPAQAEVTYVPANYVALDKDSAEKMLRLTDMLEDLDDVQHVYSNADYPEGM